MNKAIVSKIRQSTGWNFIFERNNQYQGKDQDSRTQSQRAGANSRLSANATARYSEIPGLQELHELEKELKRRHNMLTSKLATGATSTGT